MAIVGGEPKWLQVLLALDLAVAVPSGAPCLRRFGGSRGRVLLFPDEDALHVVRQRLAGIVVAAGVALTDLDVQVVAASSVRLDVEHNGHALAEKVTKLRPQALGSHALLRVRYKPVCPGFKDK